MGDGEPTAGDDPSTADGPDASGWDRDRFQARLDELVRENRFTIAVVFPVVGAATLVASSLDLLPAVLAYNPFFVLFGTLVMIVPLAAGLLPVTDRRAGVALVVVTLYAYAIEYVGVVTGVPYGGFEYTVDLGPMLFDKVPAGLPVFFIPMVLNGYLLVHLLLGDRADSWLLRVGAATGTVVFFDLILDPGAVAVQFWAYQPAGAYYGVPASNYAGWVLSGAVGVVVLDFGFDRDRLVDRLATCEFVLDNLVSFVVLWGIVNLLFLQVVPLGLSLVLAGGLLWIDRFDFPLLGGRLGRLVTSLRQ